MEVWTFFKMDLKSNWKSILSVMGMDILYACMSHTDPYYFIPSLILWTIAVANMLFDKERKQESRFLYMLPVAKQSRVLARYLMIFVFSLSGVTGYFIGKIVNYHLFDHRFEKVGASSAMLFSVTVFMISLTYIISYKVGKTESEVLDRILPILIAGVLMVGIIWMIPETVYSMLYDYVLQHMQISAILSLILSIGMWMIGMIVSSKIFEKKDFV
ncbi:MAG: ABC-2 transporter permease [Lachnospiraceae bacterium]|nr:ABC-2 transporter permease [Lachnospiraceae bacterium]